MTKRKPHNTRFQKNADTNASALLYGYHTVRAALHNPRRKLHQLFATKNAAHELAEQIAQLKLAVQICTSQQLAAKLPHEAVHQGLVLEAAPLAAPDLQTLCATGKLLIALDKVSDPRNVGAIMRAAAIFGAGGVIMTRHNSPPTTGALAKTASGALELVPLIEVGNLARALAQIKKSGYLTIGLDEMGDTPIENVRNNQASQPVACVLGAEGDGLRRLTRENCDILAHLPQQNADFVTLNVASAAAIAFYALTRAY